MFLINVMVVLALAATIGALVFGLVSMARGGEYDAHHSERYMTARVGLQGFAILLILATLYLLNA